MSAKRVYMDYNATTPLHPEVATIMHEAMDVFGNPSSLHDEGRVARNMVELARDQCANLINAGNEEIVFSGSGSEANNAVLNLFPCLSFNCDQNCQRTEIITTSIEHPCIMETSRCLTVRGLTVHIIGVDSEGRLKIDELKDKLNERTALVSVMMANNEIGTLQDIETICKLAHEQGALFHSDAIQAVGKIPVDVKKLDVDFMSFSAHKIYGPKGVGGLYVKKGVHFCPFIRGGHQEHGRRAGTENTLGIIGCGKAMECRMSELEEETTRLLKLKARFRSGIQDNIPDVIFNGSVEHCLPGTLNVSFKGCEGEALLLYLDLEGIAVSTGSACSSGSLDPSHVLLATGLPSEDAHGSIRFSAGRTTSEEDIDYVLDKLASVVKKVREMSTTYSTNQ